MPSFSGERFTPTKDRSQYSHSCAKHNRAPPGFGPQVTHDDVILTTQPGPRLLTWRTRPAKRSRASGTTVEARPSGRGTTSHTPGPLGPAGIRDDPTATSNTPPSPGGTASSTGNHAGCPMSPAFGDVGDSRSARTYFLRIPTDSPRIPATSNTLRFHQTSTRRVPETALQTVSACKRERPQIPHRLPLGTCSQRR